MTAPRTIGFRDVLAEHAAGVCIVLWYSGARLDGLTVSSVTSVSADPPVLAFSLDSSSRRCGSLLRAEAVTVSLLADDQEEVARAFAVRGGDPAPHQGWGDAGGPPPAVPRSRAWVRGAVAPVAGVGASTVFVVQALHWGMEREQRPLVWFRRGFATTATPSRPGPDG